MNPFPAVDSVCGWCLTCRTMRLDKRERWASDGETEGERHRETQRMNEAACCFRTPIGISRST